MAKGKLILICQFGGQFETNDDGTLLYTGGEANATNVNYETPLEDLKLKVAETCDLEQNSVIIKYFLPGNKRNLLTVKNDKDIKRLIDFHKDSITADVYVTGTAGFNRNALKVTASSARNQEETVVHDVVSTSPAHSSPAKRTRRATAKIAADNIVSADARSDVVTGDAGLEGSATETTSSIPSSDHEDEQPDSDSGSDYRPSRSRIKRTPGSQPKIDVNATPADTVKNRRRTPSWKFGANGPTIISDSYDDSGKKRSGAKSVLTIASQKKRGLPPGEPTELTQRKRGRPSFEPTSSGQKKRGRPPSSMKLQARKSQRVGSLIDEDTDHEIDLVAEREQVFDESYPISVYDEDVSPETLAARWKAAITGVGQEFVNVQEFRDALKKYAIANRFVYKFKKNDTNRAIGGCVSDGCSWKIYAVWVPSSQTFRIKEINKVHTCDEESRRSAYPSRNWLVNTIKERLRDAPNQKPKEVANGILRDFGVELNYSRVWRGIDDAREQLFGSHKEAYNKLPWLVEKIMETNPGSFAKLVISDKKRFKSLFVSFHASICGFQNCRPLLFLESMSLKSKYQEVMLTASAIDGNDDFFPVAFAIVDVENDDTWRWFLELLQSAVSSYPLPITFVMDREKNLKESVFNIFEHAHVGYSIYHLLESFKRNAKGPFHGEGRAFLPLHFLTAAQAVRLVSFRKATEQIKQISSQAYDWVMQIEPEHWATYSFKGERYSFVTQYLGEPFAKWIEESRELPILRKIDAFIQKMIEAIDDARLDGGMWTTKLTATKELQLQEEIYKALGLKVLISTDTMFEVREESTHVVNITNWDCTCLGWKETGLPCRHALAVFNVIGKNPYDYCSFYFTVDTYRLTYAESIIPVPIDGSSAMVENDKKDKEETEGKKDEGDIVCEIDEIIEELNRKVEDENKVDEEDTGEKDDGKVDEDVREVDQVDKDERDKELDENRSEQIAEEDKGEKDVEEDKGKKLVGEEDKCEKEVGEEGRGEKDTVEGEKEVVEEDKGETEAVEGGESEKEVVDGGKGEKQVVEEEKGEKEEDDPNVLVLPPIPSKLPSQEKEKKVDWFDEEGELKRTVTCTICKQPGHNKKSCKANL